MATLNGGSSWGGSITISKQLGTLLTLPTSAKYVDRPIEFTLGVQSGAAAANTAAADADVVSGGTSGGTNISGSIGTKTSTEPTSGYFIKVDASASGSSKVTTAGWLDTGALDTATATATKYFPVDAATASVSGTNTVTPSASIAGSNVTLSNTNNGVSVTATGGGTARASASATSTHAGYVPNGQTMASATIDAGSLTTTASSFISGITLKAPSTGVNSFAVTVPNGVNTTITFNFHVDSNGNVTID